LAVNASPSGSATDAESVVLAPAGDVASRVTLPGQDAKIGAKFSRTRMLAELVSCIPKSSVTAKLMGYVFPAWPSVGVQVKVLLRGGAPAVGSDGVITEPGGRLPLVRVTKASTSASVPVTVKVTGLFGRTSTLCALGEPLISTWGSVPTAGISLSSASTGVSAPLLSVTRNCTAK
jgi:hypothetical protein